MTALFPRIQVEVPEWDCAVSVRAPSLAEIRACRGEDGPSDLSDEDAIDAVVDTNIRLLAAVCEPERPFEDYTSGLPELRLRELLRVLAEVSGVTSGATFRP